MGESSAASILEHTLWCAITFFWEDILLCVHLSLHILCVHSRRKCDLCLPCCVQARFSTFVWVQALDLVTVATRSGALCALPSDSGLSVQLCIGLVFASHIVITYLCAGTLVWRMDRDARQSFVRQQQHSSVTVAAA